MIEVIKHTLLITSFVMTMMLIIEFINIQTKGSWSKKLQGSKWSQLLLAVLLGLLPGCMGVYTVVSLYTHNLLSLGALTASMIATSGDEAFIMLSLMPEVALKMFLIMGLVAIAAGLLINWFVKSNRKLLPEHAHFDIHEQEDTCNCYEKRSFFDRMKNISFPRAVMLGTLLIFVGGIILFDLGHSHGDMSQFGLDLPHEILPEHDHAAIHSEDAGHDHAHEHAHDHAHEHDSLHAADPHAAEGHDHGSGWGWLRITLLVALLAAIYIVYIVPDHFLEKHLWEHIIKKHFLKIFLWTFGTLVAIHFLVDYIQVDQWIEHNLWYILLLAVLIGIIPESGPHLVFLALFVSGTIPMSILLASSIVQDGHGSLPLFAESKKSFLIVKVFNMAVGLLVGGLGLWLGF